MARHDPVLTSPFKPLIESLVRSKRSLGFSYDSTLYELGRFDRFCAARGVSEPVLDRDLVAAWSEPMGTEGRVSKDGRVSAVRQLALHMLSLGLDAYVPRGFCGRGRTVPYIPTDAEVIALLAVADAYAEAGAPASCRWCSWMWLEWPVAFRLMWCCGLRISECANLMVKDVSADGTTLTIRHSKGDKDRLVYMAPDVAEMMGAYLGDVARELGHESEWAFPGAKPGRHVSKGLFCHKFQMFWDQTPAAKKSSKRPTPHSLRHAFVVRRINAWAEQGVDVESMLPFLSGYLGHAGPSETYYYYHQTIDAIRLVRDVDRVCLRVIPGVVDDG